MNELSSINLPDTATRPPRAKAVVIGSGFGGIAAALRLLARGYAVELIEALDRPGGRARVFKQDGYTFDMGPTIITAPFLFGDLWKLFGQDIADDIEMVALDPFYCLRLPDGQIFEYSGDRDKMRAQIAKVSPGEEDAYDRLMRDSEKVYKVGFEQLCHIPIDTIPKVIGIIPDLIRFRVYQSVYGNICRYFKHRWLRRIFSFHPLLIGGNPCATTAIYSLITFLEKAHGVHFARGGTGALINAMIRLFERQGGTLRLNSPVDEILIKDRTAKGVRLKSGEVINASVVVSNADIGETYGRLIKPHKGLRWTKKKIDGARHSMGLFVWYFGTNRKYDDIPHHMIILNDRYRELLKDIFDRKHLADDFSLYLHRPSATDPSLAPEGGDAFYVLSPVPNLDGETDWRTMGETYRKRIAQHLEDTVMPGLTDSIATSHFITPLDFKADMRSEKGSGFSLAPHLMQSAWFRPHNASESIDGLYLVGAGTHPGAGLPGVLSSARVVGDMVPHVTA